jgi:hypothetical protein
MKKLMNIFHSVLLPNNKLVLSGVNPKFDNLWANEIKNLIENMTVILKRPGFNDVVLHVVDIEVSNSISDKKTFFVLIDESLSPEDIIEGSELYSIN